MNAHATQLFQAALELPQQERKELAIHIIESLEAGTVPSLAPEWEEEIGKRSRELREGKVQGIPWEDVREQLRANL